MDKWRGKVAIVTGASAGIGAAIAQALARHGLTVVALARRDDKLKELAEEMTKEGAPGKVHPIKTDLRKEQDILAAFNWVEEELGGADILVNNAGVISFSYLSDGNMEDWRALLDINVLAVAFCSKLFLNSMEKRNNEMGHIFNINSIAGHTTEFNKISMYCASKHAVKAISMCLRRELAEKKSTIKVTNVSPGVVATEMLGQVVDKRDIVADKSELVALEGSDIAAAIVNALSASSVSEICEVVINPVPTKIGLY